MEFLSESILQILLFLTDLTGSLGVGIILMTILIRAVLLPVTIPSLKASKEMQKLQPELKKLKKKYKGDRKALQQAQMDLYKKYNVNPLAGCLPQIVQLGVLILLYRVLINYFGTEHEINSMFLWMDLMNPDPLYVLPILAAGTQLILSLMIAPGAEKRDLVPNDSKSKKVQEENEKEEDFAEMAQTMQKQMIYVMPLITGFIALRFPAGVALYWVVTTIFSLGQQLVVSGPGGLKIYFNRARVWIGERTA